MVGIHVSTFWKNSKMIHYVQFPPGLRKTRHLCGEMRCGWWAEERAEAGRGHALPAILHLSTLKPMDGRKEGFPSKPPHCCWGAGGGGGRTNWKQGTKRWRDLLQGHSDGGGEVSASQSGSQASMRWCLWKASAGSPAPACLPAGLSLRHPTCIPLGKSGVRDHTNLCSENGLKSNNNNN